MTNTKDIIIMHKLLLILILMTSCICFIQSQSLSRMVIGSAGSYHQNVVLGEVHFTVGEVAVSRYEEEVILEEGFHNANYKLFVSIENAPVDTWLANIYPNPTREFLVLDLPVDLVVDAQLFNELGQQLLYKKEMKSNDKLSMNTMPNGTYWLRLSNQSGVYKTFKILKIGS